MSDAAVHAEPQYEVLVVGAGFGGIATGVALRRVGVENFVLIDKWDTVGGTWNANTYPGVAVDVPSPIYNFSFQQRSQWSRFFAPGAEIQRYAEEVVDKQGLRDKLRLGCGATDARFDDSADMWRVTTDAGDVITARYLVSAVGVLEQPKLPPIDGIENYAGKMMHTARWDHSYDFSGKRVAVIGTGATALQAIPELAKHVEQLTVYQRTAIWVAPKPDFPMGTGWNRVLDVRPVQSGVRLIGNVAVNAFLGLAFALSDYPRVTSAVLGLGEKLIKGYLFTQVRDRELRRKLIPSYRLGCKRPSVSNSYFKTFTLPHVELVTTPIESFTENGIVTADGERREFDMVVAATGFKVMDKGATPPYPIYGSGGEELGKFWDENLFQSYEGVSVPGYPNVFHIFGPYGYAPGSVIPLIEATSTHAARVIAEARRRGATRAEIRREPHDEYFQKMFARNNNTYLFDLGCAESKTYYINYQGHAPALRATTQFNMYWSNRHFPLDHYRYTASRPVAGGMASTVAVPQRAARR
ncbi:MULTISPECIES: NAD(P)/FAD-dependent oxidoreductase [unclassified Mycobacterium]|uniref:flavin-containing monooxygenase n=1 Tax=unclassified Mycobacterium TaxID=2642494 RepID=UPI0007404E82|nr:MULTISPECIES: NAD(P)/FAD-dependent oxidoreductase [unclassified Mycobacterium]KUH82382.1 monooxygenase [Mycobacterium sp. GA-0227b]KUH88944.1 monooxygenase [Mycobacterium sp. GA-1999]